MLYYTVYNMPNPENIQRDESELVMLRSDLFELFQTHANEIIVRQSDNWEQPTEVMLSGIYQFTKNGSITDIDIHVRQRLDRYGTDYLVITGQPNDYYWCQITDYEATSIATQKPMDDNDVIVMRRILSSGTTTWSEDSSRLWRYLPSPYDAVEEWRVP